MTRQNQPGRGERTPRSKTDWAGMWFSFLPEFDEHPYIAYGCQRTGAEPLEWCELPHEKFDGVGGFVHLLRQQGIEFGELPRLRDRRAPHYLVTLKKLYGVEIFPPAVPYHWDVEYHEPPYEIHFPVHLPLDRDTTAKIRESAQAQNVSLNSFLIYCLNRAVQDRLLNKAGFHRWMIPANMRGQTGIKDETANQASCLTCLIRAESTCPEIHQMIKKQFSSDAHWHTWRLLNIGKIIGRRALRYLYRRQYHSGPPWTGVFSNLGEWTLSGESSWYFTPPVTRGCPIAAGAITINDRLHLAVQTHHGWKDNSAHARNILECWANFL